MVARLLLLASDASIATKMDDNNSSTLIRITQTLSSVLNSINTHAYMSTHKADKALLLLSLLMKESKPKGRYFRLLEHKVLFLLPVVCCFSCAVIHSFFINHFLPDLIILTKFCWNDPVGVLYKSYINGSAVML
jgi:hypothetical protein